MELSFFVNGKEYVLNYENGIGKFNYDDEVHIVKSNNINSALKYAKILINVLDNLKKQS